MTSVSEVNNVKWKPESLNQEVPVFKRNERSTLSIGQNIFRALPLRIYRKELLFSPNDTTNCNASSNITVNNFEIPGGAITTTTQNNISVPLYYVNTTNNEICPESPCPNVNSVQTNALRRLRSNGMIKKNYFTSNRQYLNNRNVSYERQHYSILRTSDDEGNNTYSTNGLPPSCNETKKYSFTYYKPNNSQFSTQGAVSNGSYIERLKYDSARTTAASYTNLYGSHGSGYGHSTKMQIGYSAACSPKFSKGSNDVVFCYDN